MVYEASNLIRVEDVRIIVDLIDEEVRRLGGLDALVVEDDDGDEVDDPEVEEEQRERDEAVLHIRCSGSP